MINQNLKNMIIEGVTGAGKSQFLRTWLSKLYMLPATVRPAIFLFDGPGTLADQLHLDLLYAGRGNSVLCDYMYEMRKTLGYDFCTPSQNPVEIARRAEDRLSIETSKSQIVFSRGVLDDSGNPIIREALDTVLWAYICCDVRVPSYWLRDILKANSKAQRFFIKHCKRKDIADKLMWYSRLPMTQWEYRCGAVDRILENCFDDPAFQIRDGATFDFGAFIGNGGIWLGSGQSRGNVSRSSTTNNFIRVLGNLLSAARNGVGRNIVVVIDEGQTTSLISPQLCRSLLEYRKWGVQFVFVVHNLRALPPELRELILAGCRVYICFAQVSPEAVKHAAEILSTPCIDLHKIHSTEYITRTVDDGYDIIDTVTDTVSTDEKGNKREGTNKAKARIRRTKEVSQARHRYITVPEIKAECERDITQFDIGDFGMRDGGRVLFGHVDMKEFPWSGLADRNTGMTRAEQKMQVAWEQMLQRPEYRIPEITEPPETSTTNESGSASNGSSIPTRFRKSSTSSKTAPKSKNPKKRTDS